MELVDYAPWGRCARLQSGEIEAAVTLEFGPRVIRLGFVGGPNLFAEFAAKPAGSNDEWISRGGHRLWVAPESPLSYEPDNLPVEITANSFHTPLGISGLSKSIELQPVDQGFRIIHKIANLSLQTYTLAPWALSVMAPGGVCLWPQADFQPHPVALLPVRPLVHWAYTNLADPRLTLGPRLGRLRQEEGLGPTKLGSFIDQGFAAYYNEGTIFIKTFESTRDVPRVDLGCNFETFTTNGMLEVESVGPLRTLFPGDIAIHVETWKVARATPPPADDDEAADWLKALAP